jgi:hypothetical protein
MNQRKPCQCGRVLSKGLYCDRGYLFIRLFPEHMGGEAFLEGCGPHTTRSEDAANIKLSSYRQMMLLGQFEEYLRTAAVPAITGNQACDIYLQNVEGSLRDMAELTLRIDFRPRWGKKPFHLINSGDIYNWREEKAKTISNKTGQLFTVTAINRYQGAISAMFSTLERLVKTERVPAFKLPPENPCGYVKKPSEADRARDRVPNRAEMVELKQWCINNDPELWQGILQATVTFLRKKDFVQFLENGQQQDGVQAKTGKKFKVHAKFPKPANFINWRKRWGRCRIALGWSIKDTPKHTVWHDLRHWGPTILAELGYSGKIIQKLTGHATEAMADRYTHLRDDKQKEAVNAVLKEMESL